MARRPPNWRAQRRSGPKPRRHRSTHTLIVWSMCAQRRSGPKPRRHRSTHTLIVWSMCAQRRSGLKPRRHLYKARPRQDRVGPLNEGRGRNPDDTYEARPPEYRVRHAQRRSGPKPRRHSIHFEINSSKWYAQRRSGPKPRRHRLFLNLVGAERPSLNEGRGPKPRRHLLFGAGVLACVTFAQRRSGPETPTTPLSGWI